MPTGSNAIRSIAIVDAGPLIAAVDAGDRDHARCLAVLQRADLAPVIPAMVLCAVSFFLGRRAGAQVEAAFFRGLRQFDVEAPFPEDFERIAELVEQYADFPLGGTDASVVALAERLHTDVIVTLDRRHFGAIRPQHVETFRLLPE